MKIKMVVVLFLLLSAAFFAVAQVSAPLVVSVPFSFYVGNKLLPAGSYKFQINADQLLLNVTSENGKNKATAVVIDEISSNPEDKDSVVFDVTSKAHYVSEIYIQGDDGMQIKAADKQSHTHVRIKAK